MSDQEANGIVAGVAVVLRKATLPVIQAKVRTPSSDLYCAGPKKPGLIFSQLLHENELMLQCYCIVFEESVGVPSALITLSLDLEEYFGRRAGWTAIGAYAAHARNGASAPGMSISKRASSSRMNT